MRALTLWRPWPFAILHLPESQAKRVENRPWKPWPSVIGTRIALHAGKKYDRDAELIICGAMEAVGLGSAVDPRMYREGIVGTAVVKGWIELEHIQRGLNLSEWDYAEPPSHSETLTEAEACAAYASRWFFGPYGWVLEDVRALPEPISCKGMQGLWTLPADIAVQVMP